MDIFYIALMVVMAQVVIMLGCSLFCNFELPLILCYKVSSDVKYLTPRFEHIKRSPKCAFLHLKGDFPDLTLAEMFHLESERVKIFVVSDCDN